MIELFAALHAVHAVAQVLAGYCAFYVVLWMLYVFVIGLDRQLHAPAILGPDGVVLVQAGMAKPARYLGTTLALGAHLMNFIGNVGLTFVLLEPPREVGITLRLTRWIERMPDKRAPIRKALALWLRKTWLDGYDRKGIHRAE